MKNKIIQIANRPLMKHLMRRAQRGLVVTVNVEEEGWTCIFVDDCYCAVDNNTKRIIHSGNGKGQYTPARRAKVCAAVEQWRKRTSK